MKTELYEGALEVLSALARRGLTMDAATNKPSGVTSSILAQLKIDRFFRSVMAVDAINPPFSGKSAILRHLLALHRLEAEHTVCVGDTAEDAAAAAECGIRFVWAAYGYGKPEAGAAVYRTINRLAELVDIR
jgi:phosphoglycolate phosphatase